MSLENPDSASEPRPSVTFDHHVPGALDPYQAWGELRQTTPLAWSEHHGGYWLVTKREDITRVLKDHERFSPARNEYTGDASALSLPSRPVGVVYPQELDPPRSFPYRRILTSVLSPPAVEAMRDRVRYWVDWHIDQFIERGTCDFVYDLTAPVTGAVALEWLGFPREDWQRMSEAQHDSSCYPLESERAQKAFDDLRWTAQRVSEEIAIRREEHAAGRPRDDAMSIIATHDVEGEMISVEFAESMVRLLISAGVDTTSASTTSALVHLHHHPDHRAALIEQPELWDTAIEELLRRYPAVLGLGRSVRADTEIRGCPLHVGERMIVGYAAGCHDAEAFPQPYDVALDRSPNRHLAFGMGAHRCVGMHLARLLMREMLTRVLDRLPDYVVAEQALQRYDDQSAIAGWRSAPARFTPSARCLGGTL